MTTIYTIGHGNRGIEDFLAVLMAHRIEHLVDVRAYPASRRHPHFSRAALQGHLTAANIAYAWEGAALGGKRKPGVASPHVALQASMRGYADHMASAEFGEALARLTALAAHRRAAIMCAEKLPCHCHRSLISDALTVRSLGVLHMIDTQQPVVHELSQLACPQGATLIYNRGSQLLLL